MDYNVFISDMFIGQELEGFYLLKDAAVKTTSAGKPYLTGVLSDTSGNIDMKLWELGGQVGVEDVGSVVKVRASVSEYRGSLQLSVSRIRRAAPNDKYSIAALVPTAPIDADKTIGEIFSLVDSIKDADYKTVCLEMLSRHKEELIKIPAAKSVHHSFLSGLLMHTSNMLCLADYLSSLYSDVIDRDLLLAGTLLHDFAKAKEFVFSELGMAVDYSVKGQLLGHLVMGAQEIAEVCRELDISDDKSVLLQHMILSHHGEPEFGAAVVPQFAEAELLHLIDAIDSRMEIYAETLQNVPVNSFSGRIFALEKKIFNHG